MFDDANLSHISDVDQTIRCLVRIKDPYIIDVLSPSKCKSRYKKEIKQRLGLNSIYS